MGLVESTTDTSNPVANEPIHGVSLADFAAICAGLAAYNYDQSKAVEIAATKGFDAASYEAAEAGWNERILADPAIAREFNRLYHQG